MSPRLDLAFDDKCVLITGGAGGLGSVAAEYFIAAGAKVIVVDKSQSHGEALMGRLSASANGRLLFRRLDIEQLDAAAQEVRQLSEIEGVDILVNNAAIYPSKQFSDYSIEEYQRVQATNASAAFALSQAVLPGMVGRRWGRIVNISSITFFGAWANLAPYVISKGSLIGLTRAIAREYGAHGITSNAICPGAFPTEAERIQGDAEAYTKFVLDHQAIKRRGTPQDFASVLLFLASEHSAFVTGQALNVDGGWFMC